jgi:hypothetical protein
LAAFLVGGSDTSPNERKSFFVSILVFLSSALLLLTCSARISLNLFVVEEPGAFSSVSWTTPAMVDAGSTTERSQALTPDITGSAFSSCGSGSAFLV